MKKNKYIAPEMEIVELEPQCVIASSPTIGGDGIEKGDGDSDDNDPD